MTDILDVIHQRRFTPCLQSIRDLVEDTKPDVAVVTGDTVPPPFVNSLNAFFGNLFPAELPVVATLGNHEFWGRPFEETLEEARNQNVEAPVSISWMPSRPWKSTATTSWADASSSTEACDGTRTTRFFRGTASRTGASPTLCSGTRSSAPSTLSASGRR